MDKLLPTQYSWLYGEDWPPMLYHAIQTHGVTEAAGSANNDIITSWAREAAAAGAGTWLADYYKEDSVPWCGLAVAAWAARSGYAVQPDCLSARGWLDWGDPVTVPALGDVLVFWRGRVDGRNGHVGLYVGEDDEAFHVIGGNQGDAVSIARIAKTRLLGVRRWPGAKVGRPVPLDPGGAALSENEA